MLSFLDQRAFNAIRFVTMGKHVLLQLLLTCALLSSAPGALAQAPEAAEFELPADPRMPFLVVRETPSELAGAHTRVLRVFGDGHCELERPPIMRGAGKHQWTLAPEEMQALARQVLDAGVAELDVPAMRTSLKAGEASDDADGATYRFDHDVLEIELRFDRYRRRGGAMHRGFERRLHVVGLRADRARHPNDDRIRRLSELRDSLEGMTRVHAPLPEPGP